MNLNFKMAKIIACTSTMVFENQNIWKYTDKKEE